MNPRKLKGLESYLITAQQTMKALLPIAAYNEAVAGPAYQALDKITLRYLRLAYSDICEALTDDPDQLQLPNDQLPDPKAFTGAFMIPDDSTADFLVHFDSVITKVIAAATSQNFYESRRPRRDHAILSLELAAEELGYLISKRLSQVVS